MRLSFDISSLIHGTNPFDGKKDLPLPNQVFSPQMFVCKGTNWPFGREGKGKTTGRNVWENVYGTSILKLIP